MRKIRVEMMKKICLMAAIVFVLALSTGFSMASSGGEGGHGEPKGWVATDTYRVLNFTVLFIALFYIARKPVSEALNKRIADVKKELADLEAEKAAAEKQLVEYNNKIAQLDSEAEKIMTSYIEQGKNAKAKILEEAQNAAVKLESQAARNIENEINKAKLELQAEIVDKALKRAEEIVTQSITPEDQDRLVDDYLNKVVA